MIIIALTITKEFHLESYIGSMSCIVICIMMLAHRAPDANPVHYVGTSVIETLSGIIVAEQVNKYVNFKHNKE